MKLTLRAAKYKFSGKPIKYENIEIECSGTGVEKDPLILDSTNLPKHFEILNSNQFIIIKNCQSRISIYYSKNIRIENSNARNLFLKNCSHIQVVDTLCSFINLFECNFCSLIKCRCEESINLYKCNNNLFKDCEFWNFFTDLHMLSRNNKVENVAIGEDLNDPDLTSIQDSEEVQKNTYLLYIYSNSEGYKSIEVKCKGSGTLDSPIIINSLDSLEVKAKTIDMYHGREFIVFKGINVKKINFYDVKYVTLENCAIEKSVLLKFCSEIKIKSTYIETLKLGESYKIDINNSEFNKIKILKNMKSEISLLNCKYKKFNAKVVLN